MNIRHVADVRRSASSHDTDMSARSVMLAVVLLSVVSCSAPELAPLGLTDELAAATPGPARSRSCPAAPGTVSGP